MALSELHQQAAENGLQPDTIVLGCTHYPLLRPVIEVAVSKLWPGQPPSVIDSAEATASEVERQLAAFSSKVDDQPNKLPLPASFFATDSVTKFRQLGTRFLGQPIGEVQLVDLGG